MIGGRCGRAVRHQGDERGRWPAAAQSHLFTVRLWVEDLGDGRTEWRGQVQHVLSGETHSFRERPTLLTLLRAMLPPAATDSAPDALNEHVRPS